MIDQHQMLHENPTWNVIILPDALRYDVFREVLPETPLKGKHEEAFTGAHHTQAWYDRNWSREVDETTIYVGTHPFAERFGIWFYKSYPFLELEEWLNPDCALQKALEVQKEFPDKKLLVHLLQPHLPFLGPKGWKFLEGIWASPNSDLGMNTYDVVSKWGREHGWKELREYYRENVEFILRRIEKYIHEFKGEVIITSDHGELLGECNKYGHAIGAVKGIYVPWFKLTR